MFSCAIVLLLINTFYGSFGYPLAVNETLGKSLQLLAENCQNIFLSTQIKNHLEKCNIIVSPDREIKVVELECLIFYDINRRLCATSTLRSPKLNLNETYELEINQVQKVEKTCTEASKNWTFTNITEYPMYYNTSHEVFKNFVTCLKVCGVDVVASEDTNFFCKYYQWGSELLQIPTEVVSGESASRHSEIKTTKAPGTNSGPTLKPVVGGQNINNESQIITGQEQPQAQVEIPGLSEIHDEQLSENGAQLSNNHQDTLKPAQSPKNNTNVKPENSNNKPPGIKPVNNQKPKPDDYPETREDGDPGFDVNSPEYQSQDDGDRDDPSVDTVTNTQIRNKPHRSQSLPSPDVQGQPKEIYTSTMSEQFGEVDDHFFSFFLTATILVIFFYVLYHNKSKFRKVFLGLLVEGRQPGRRRNSRGHEYRRLDTLEQAMSTNSAAPPSKIIY